MTRVTFASLRGRLLLVALLAVLPTIGLALVMAAEQRRLKTVDVQGLCRKFCSGSYEGAVTPVCVGITQRGSRTIRPQ